VQLGWIITAGGRDTIGYAEILEYFQRARLEPLAPRAAKWTLHLLDHPARDAPAAQIDRQSESGRASAAK
jgi:hypothetical protein